MRLMLFVLEPLLLTNAVLWEFVAGSHIAAGAWIGLALGVPRLARWVKDGS